MEADKLHYSLRALGHAHTATWRLKRLHAWVVISKNMLHSQKSSTEMWDTAGDRKRECEMTIEDMLHFSCPTPSSSKSTKAFKNTWVKIYCCSPNGWDCGGWHQQRDILPLLTDWQMLKYSPFSWVVHVWRFPLGYWPRKSFGETLEAVFKEFTTK